MPPVDHIQASLEATVEVARGLARRLPQKGNTSEECQRIAIINALEELQKTINGLEPQDHIPGPNDIPGDNNVEDVLRSVRTLHDNVRQMSQHSTPTADSFDPGH